MAKNIIVLGGGYAGVMTAKGLAKQVSKNKLEGVNIKLIDKNPFHTMLTELHEVAANRVHETSIKMDLKKIMAGRNVEVVLDEISKMDLNGNKLEGKKQSYTYDYLVVATGSKPTYFGVEGAAENAFPLWSYDDAVNLKNHIITMFRKAESETNPELKKQMLTFFVVGAGFTGVEMVGELAEWLPELLDEFHFSPSEVSINLVDMLPRVIPTLPEHLSQRAHNRLVKMGVNVKLGQGVVGVGQDFIRTKLNDKVTETKTSTVIWAAGIEGSQVVMDSAETVARGRIETNEYLQSKKKDNVYIAGDNIYYIPEGEKMSVPQMVENAEACSHLIAHNIVADIQGKPQEKHKYAPKFHGMMVCIGGRYGVAYVGTHTKKFGLPSFMAMLSKHLINLVYFVQVLGWNKVYNYLLHEILRIRDNRSFVGGYFSNYSPNFWSVPLRMFLGYMWLASGLDKWPKIVSDFNNIFLFSIPGADAASGATAVSGASAAADAAAYGPALPVPGFISTMVDLVMGTFVAPIAPQFQAMMIIAEIVLGVLFIFGLFNAVSSLVSALLCVMIYTSGMSDISIIWYLTASIALIGIGGTGQTFSLDYYLMPRLKRWWRNIGFVKKWYIYND